MTHGVHVRTVAAGICGNLDCKSPLQRRSPFDLVRFTSDWQAAEHCSSEPVFSYLIAKRCTFAPHCRSQRHLHPHHDALLAPASYFSDCASLGQFWPWLGYALLLWGLRCSAQCKRGHAYAASFNSDWSFGLSLLEHPLRWNCHQTMNYLSSGGASSLRMQSDSFWRPYLRASMSCSL